MRAESRIINVITGIAGLILAGTSWADILTFHPESAIYGGNGCPQGSSRIYVDELGGLVMEHDALGISLYANGDTQALAQRSACSIRVPVTLPRGFYVKSIEQRIVYAVGKSANAEARIASRTALSGDTVHPFTVLLPYGEEMYTQNMIDSRRDRLDTARRRAQDCAPDRSEKSMLQVNVAMSGQRDSASDDLVLVTYGGYVGEGFEIEIEPCP